MDTTIGTSAQTSLVAATQASASTQLDWFGRWVSAPLAAQTLSNSQALVGNAGWQMSNTNSAMTAWLRVAVFVWRPDTGAVRNTPHDLNGGGSTLTSNTTQQAIAAAAGAFLTDTGTWTVVDGDVLVVEIYGDGTQGMNTSYNRTFWYDGTTEASATNNAAYIEFSDTISFFTAYQPRMGFVNHQNPGLVSVPFTERVRRLWNGWSRRPSGVLVPA